MSPISTTLHDVPPFRLRGLAYLSLKEAGRVLNLSYVDNQGGGMAGTYAAGTADLPCRIDPLGGGAARVADRIDDRSTHVITTMPDAAVGPEDLFSISGRGTYEITAVRERTGGALKLLEAIEAG